METEVQNVEVETQVDADPMAAELAELEAQIKAEEAGQAEPPKSEPEAPAPQEAAPAQPEAPQKGDPMAAVIALRHKTKQLEQQNLLLQGQVQALSAIAQGKSEPGQEMEPEPKAPTLDSIRAQKKADAKAFDAGDISAEELEARRQALDDQEWELRTASIRQPQPQAQPATDLQLEQATAKLEADYPVLSILTADDIEPLAQLAYRQAARDGKPIQPGAVGTLELRTRIAKIAQQMYGGGTQGGTQTPQAQTELSPQARAREAKLDMAARMPPDVSKMGSAATDVLTNESDILNRMEGMSEEEQWALMKTLPGSTRTALGLR